jgi:hypothetical protein
MTGGDAPMPRVAEMIGFLIAARFPDHRAVLEPENTVRRAGTRAMSEEERQGRLAEITAYDSELRGKPAAELADMCQTERQS